MRLLRSAPAAHQLAVHLLSRPLAAELRVRRLHTSSKGWMLQYVRAIDLSVERSWDLLRWCLADGATEFSLREMSFVGHVDPVVQHANATLASFRLPEQPRPRSVVYSGEPERQPVKLWRLNEQSISALSQLLANGLFTEPTGSQNGWVEDPTVYRDSDIVLGVVSHEGEAFLNVSASEAEELMRLGFVLYPRGLYI